MAEDRRQLFNKMTKQQKEAFSKDRKNLFEDMTNKKLLDFYDKTDNKAIDYMFHDEYKLFENASNSSYGSSSKSLLNNIGNIKKNEWIIISINNKDVNNCNKIGNVQFIPFDKIFFQTGIRYINPNGELTVIDSFIIVKDYNLDICNLFCILKYPKRNFACTVCSHKFKDSEMNMDFIAEELRDERSMDRINSLKTDSDLQDAKIRFNLILKVLRYVSYKISTKEFRDYKICNNGQLVNKELIYSSEVKAHKRHFWEDTGRFIIPTLSKQEILKRGYGIDELVYKNNQLRRNVPYTIIGNSIRNKELEKQNKRIDLIKKRIWKCEEKIYDILREIYPDKIIRRHDRKTLKGLELDFNLPEFRLGIEYDGEQHFDEDLYKKLYGDGFHDQIRRDRMKNVACRRKKIKLVRIKYNEKLTVSNIKKLIAKPFQYGN